MNTNYFAECTTVETVKARLRELAKIHHPDLGGDEEIMKAINSQYHDALKRCNGKASKGSDGKDHVYAYDEALEEALWIKICDLVALKMESVDVLLIGTWLWIVGDTKPHKDTLKTLECKWHSKRKCWYYRHGEGRYYKSNASLSGLAMQYGVVDCSRLRKDKEESKRKAIA